MSDSQAAYVAEYIERPRATCLRCDRTSYTLANFGWCPWCDTTADAHLERQAQA